MKHKPAFPEVEITLKAADCNGVLWLHEGQWTIASLDPTNGQTHISENVSAAQAAAVLQLFVTGGVDNMTLEDETKAYELCKPLFTNWPLTASLIP